ncbi:hypothetical protein ABZ801_01460 [Actinomadura sp. NPDC047616]|uniref:hypothetical protein n=1 Tax=Actinomadura sp. NPDC047616 TaxID=3155914 RepID=UPI003403CA97
MDDRTGELDSYAPLAALGARLSARRLTVDCTSSGLRVKNPRVPGCCAEVAHPCDTIRCRRRADDGGTPWYFTSWHEPIAPADAPDDAAMFVLGYLARRPERARPEGVS